MATLAEIRARIAAQENKSQQKSQSSNDNAIYPHWNMEEGKTATIRFLPDGNNSNPYFWVERQIIKLPFNGVEGQPNFKQVIVQVPCVEMYGDNCPVLAEVRAWYKDPSLTSQANKYWKKRSYLFQGFVRQNPLSDDTPPENPIRRFIISPQIIPIVKAGLMDPEILEMPTDYVRGLDFNIKKTSKGGYADYSTSNWSRRESPLTEAEQQAIETYGLSNLAEFLPKKPSEAELKIIKEMFDASVEGRPYDPAKWGAYYKPYGVDVSTARTSESKSVSVQVPQNVVVEDKAQDAPPFDTEDSVEASVASEPIQVPKTTDKATDILALIRARQKG